MATRRQVGRPRRRVIDTGVLLAAVDAMFPSTKRTVVYRELKQMSGISERTIRHAFNGKCSDVNRGILEQTLRLPIGSLVLSEELDDLMVQLRETTKLLRRMRHADEQQFRAIMPDMMSVTCLLNSISKSPSSLELDSTDKIFLN